MTKRPLYAAGRVGRCTGRLARGFSCCRPRWRRERSRTPAVRDVHRDGSRPRPRVTAAASATRGREVFVRCSPDPNAAASAPSRRSSEGRPPGAAFKLSRRDARIVQRPARVLALRRARPARRQAQDPDEFAFRAESAPDGHSVRLRRVTTPMRTRRCDAARCPCCCRAIWRRMSTSSWRRSAPRPRCERPRTVATMPGTATSARRVARGHVDGGRAAGLAAAGRSCDAAAAAGRASSATRRAPASAEPGSQTRPPRTGLPQDVRSSPHAR